MKNNQFSLFPPISGRDSSVLETSDDESGIEINREVVVEDLELNKEAPGLFPPLNPKTDKAYTTFETKSIHFSSDTASDDKRGRKQGEHASVREDIPREASLDIDFQIFQENVVDKLPRDYNSLFINDKFFLTKLYRNTNNIYFQDFDEYDNTMKLEDQLREMLLDITTKNDPTRRLSDIHQGLNIPIIPEEGLNDLYLYSREPDIRFFKNLKRQRKSSILYTLKNGAMKLSRKAASNNKSTIEEPKMELERINSGPSTVCLDESQSLSKRQSVILYKKLNKNTKFNIDEKLGLDSSDYIGSLNDLEKEKLDDLGLQNKKTVVLSSNVTNMEYGTIKSKSEYTLQRKLRMRHLQMLSIGASVGIGLFLQSGKAISIAGGLGAWLGFFISATLVISTLLCFGEIVALLPVNTGVPGILYRLLNPSLSFSVSWVYLLSYCLSVPSEILAGSLLLGYFDNASLFLQHKGNMALVLVLFCSFIIFINLLDVRVYAEFEYITSTGKIIIIVGMIIFMIILNAGGVKTTPQTSHYMGFRYWDSKKKFPDDPSITFGPFRPTFDLNDLGFGAKNGIGGGGGVILQIIAASSVAVYSYIGTEIGFIGAAESSVQLRRSISSVAKRIYIRVILFYLISIFLISILIYSGDPRLLKYRNTLDSSTSNVVKGQVENILNTLHLMSCRVNSLEEKTFFDESAANSPWIIMLSNFNLCKFAKVLDGMFVAIALCAGSSQLYVSSRILHSMSIQDKAPKIFSKCNKHGVPYVAVLACGAFSYLSLLGLNTKSVVSLNRLVQMGSQGAVIMWFSMNVAFLRFYYAVKSRPDLLDRNSNEYPYKSPLQPYMAYYGAVASAFLFLVSGFANFIEWETIDFIVDYLLLVVLVVLYIAYQLIKRPKVFWDIEDIDLDIGRKELDRELWQEDTEYMPTFKEALKKILSYI